MNISQTIRVDINNIDSDKYLKVKLNQNIDFLELLTLNIKTKDIYRNFNSDYGVLVGRVIANNGIGIPNAKISIFIPLSEEDEYNENIKSIYPYKTPQDKNLDGKKYNLLPRVSELEPLSGFHKPNQPFGTFPIKPEIITNRTIFEVYKKYYKYTTSTNEFGDYMIFGAPLGLQTIHMSVDITDIGRFSMTPEMMINILGYSESLFIKEYWGEGENDFIYKIKPTTNLDDLPHIETQEVSANIRPFWGDKENFEIGFTRQDFRIKSELENSFIVFGSAFTDDEQTSWGRPEHLINGLDSSNLYKININDGSEENIETLLNKLKIENKRPIHDINEINEDDDIEEYIYYYLNPNSPLAPMLAEKGVDYIKKIDNGNFVFKIFCNARKVIFDDLGNEIEVSDSYPDGIYTRFYGFIVIDSIQNSLPSISVHAQDYTPFRTRIKIPQIQEGAINELIYFNESFNFHYLENGLPIDSTDKWIKHYKTFMNGKIYSISKFNPTIFNETGVDDALSAGIPDNEEQFRFFENDDRNDLTKNNPLYNVGIIKINNDDSFPHNHEKTNGVFSGKYFGANWLNFSLYLPQILSFKAVFNVGYEDEYKYVFTNTYFSGWRYDYSETKNPYIKNEILENVLIDKDHESIGGTARFLRKDIHWTDFIEVPLSDILKINEEINKRGFNSSEIDLIGDEYKGGLNWSPWGGGKIDGDPNGEPDEKSYFYLGKGDENCIQHLLNSDLL